MIKHEKLLREELSGFLSKKSSRWDFGNKILYDMCSDNPLHDNPDVIVGKLWIIGRSYAAAIERRRSNTDFRGDFYYEIVAPKMLSIGNELDRRVAAIKKYPLLTEQNLDLVLTTHKFLMDTFYEITELEKRSLVSKYLHFHCPNLFLIYDSIANQNIRNRVKLDKEKAAEHYACGCDKEYADFCIRVLELRQFVEDQFGKVLSPRELDNLLLWN